MPAAACLVTVRARPNARRDELAGWMSGVLKVRVHAPALDGRANDALCAFLAERLQLPRRAVSVARGDHSRNKSIRIEGLDLAGVRARLGA